MYTIDNNKKVRSRRMKSNLSKFFTFFLALLIVLSVPMKTSAAEDFAGNTHEKDIRKMIELGIMSGYGPGQFKPSNNVTRAQFAKMIAKALELPEVERPSGFHDVAESHGSKNDIMAAAEAGIITGDRGYFKPNQHISRQHMAVMIHRALTFKDIDEYTMPLIFNDKGSINKSYHDAVGTTVYYGIFRGDGDQFKPLNNATRGHGAAAISRFLEVIETGLPIGGIKPTPPVEQPPAIPEDPEEQSPAVPTEPEEPLPEKPTPPPAKYGVATVSNDGKVSIVKNYETFEQANQAASGSQVVTYNNDILIMSGGIGYSRGAAGSSTANIYSDSGLRHAFTYVAGDYELEYLDATKDYVQVKVAGKVGYMKQENIKLVPWNATKGRSYYRSSNGALVHAIYSERKNSYVSYIAGKAPAFMIPNQKYFSWNGSSFTDESGKFAGQASQYFQYLPIRSKTAYTAKEIDAYIMKQLKDIEGRNSLYQDASTKSKIIGLGEYLKQVEEDHQINAMAILSLANHESAYGMSKRAQEHNNLFGLRVFDDNPDDIEYESIEKNIDSLINNYFNKNYVPPTAPYAYGGAFGNKAQGMNVKYASDPFWGSKAAGHWYRSDLMMGGKDLQAAHRIALTNTAGLNVRTGASTSNTRLFRYRYSQMPVIILDDVAKSPWKKILSDAAEYGEVFVHGDYLTELTVVK